MLLLTGCVLDGDPGAAEALHDSPVGSDSDSAVDSVGADVAGVRPTCPSPADAGDDAWVRLLQQGAEALAAEPVGECGALVDPWPAALPADAIALWALVMSTSGFNYRYVDWPEDCPCDDASGDPAGPCVGTDGTRSTGWQNGGSYGGSGCGGITLAAWGIASAAAGGSYSFLADGSASSCEGSRSFQMLRESHAGTGTFDLPPLGTRIRNGRFEYGPWYTTADFYFRIVDDPVLTAGDVCLTVDVADGACTLEPVGAVVVEGLHRLEVVFDGDVACDGCGSAYVDGAAAGAVCGELPLSWGD